MGIAAIQAHHSPIWSSEKVVFSQVWCQRAVGGEDRVRAGSPLACSEVGVVLPHVLSQAVQQGWGSGFWGPWKAPTPCPLPSPSPGDPPARKASAWPGMAPRNPSHPCQMGCTATSAWCCLGLLQVTGKAGWKWTRTLQGYKERQKPEMQNKARQCGHPKGKKAPKWSLWWKNCSRKLQ